MSYQGGTQKRAQALLSQECEQKALELSRKHIGEPLRWPFTGETLATELVDAMRLAFVPDPRLTEEGARRWQHDDLPSFDEVRLWQETERGRFLAAWLDPKHRHYEWITERLKACQEEMRRRKGAQHGR